MDDPTRFLTEPSAPDADWTHGFVNPIDVFNYVSPSAWIVAGIERLSGVDIFAWATQCLAGDWEALWKFGTAMGNLAQCMQQIGMNVQEGMLVLDRSWDGNANDAAYRYFSHLAATISGQQTALYNSQEGYHKAAQGAWQLANQLGNLLQAIADKFILLGVTAAAEGALAVTGVGLVVSAGVGALLVLQILDLINKASLIINTAGTVVLGLFGAVIDGAAQVNHLSSVPLPATGFTRPGV